MAILEMRRKARQFGQYLIELNLFKAVETDDQSLRHTRWSTRLYLLLLSGSLLILLFYYGFSGQATTIEVNSPSVSVYNRLQKEHGSSLKCPCSKAAIEYQNFLQVEFSFHAVCSSGFVDQAWINYLFNENISYYFANDFRVAATGQFQLLAELCRTAIDTVNNAFKEFSLSELISFDVLNPFIFESLIQAHVRDLQATTTNSFLQTLRVVRATTSGNALMTGFGTNAIFVLYQFNQGSQWITGIRLGFFLSPDNTWCYCSESSVCYTPAAFYDALAGDGLYKYYSYAAHVQANIIGWNAGCFPMESLLSSSLTCFFEASCLHLIHSLMNSSTASNFTPLITDTTSRFRQNTTLDAIVQELFIEDIETNTSFESYFTACRPSSCSYPITKYWDTLFIISTFLSLYGGLIVVLRLVAFYLIKLLFRLKRFIVTEENAPQDHSNSSLRLWVRSSIRSLHSSLQTLNVFPTNGLPTSSHQLHGQRLSTRLYLLLLALSLAVLFFYNSIEQTDQAVNVQNPSLETYERLQKLYNITLQCPCTKPAVTYGSFLELKPVYHSICSSNFVSEDWIEWIPKAQIYLPYLYHLDFRLISPALFQSLADFCTLADEIILDALHVWYGTQLISGQLSSSTLFTWQTSAAIARFQSTTPNSFERLFDLTRNVTHVNQFMTWSRQNTVVTVKNQTTGHLRMSIGVGDLQSTNETFCSCSIDPTCNQPQGIFQYNAGLEIFEMLYLVPGFNVACFPLESLLQSSLECFYDQVCLEMIYESVASNVNRSRLPPWNFTALQGNASSLYSPSTVLDLIVRNLFVEHWISNISYASYFSSCLPSLCTYTKFQRPPLIAVITRLVGLFGGVSIVLRLFTPFFISLIHRERRAINDDQSQSKRTTLINRMSAFLRLLRGKIIHLLRLSIRKVYHLIMTLNLFEKSHTTRSEHQISLERWTTRLYIALLVAITGISIVYIVINVQVLQLQVHKPSLTVYENLQNIYGNTLVCDCSQMYIPVEKILYMKPTFHQICTSDFVSDRWINYLFNSSDNLQSSSDFGFTSVPHFQALLSFCTLALQAFNVELDLFFKSTTVSAHLISSKAFYVEMQSAIETFQATVPRTFLRNMNLVQGVTQGNAILSAYTTNWNFVVEHEVTYGSIYTKPQEYADCNCGTSPYCSRPSTLQNWTVPGFQTGCLPSQSFLQSTLECLFHAECLNKMTSLMSNSTTDFTILSTSLPTRFKINATLNELVATLFVESWATNISFQNYFSECQPSTCVYSVYYSLNIPLIITKIMGLLGGLTVALRILTPFIVNVGRKVLRRKMTMRTIPMSNDIATITNT